MYSRNKDTRPRWQHAVVIGGGYSGLLAARVLAEHFREVTIVERDRLTQETGHRSGVPQAHHPHAMLARGAHTLEELFPGIQKELCEAGAVPADVGSHYRTLLPGGWTPRDEVGMSVLSLTRVTLETTIRRRVLAIPSVTLVDGVQVDGLAYDAGRVTGIVGRRRNPLDGDDAALSVSADLVVDASGRTSRLPDWLDQLGFGRPEQKVVDGHLAYNLAPLPRLRGARSRLAHVLPDDVRT